MRKRRPSSHHPRVERTETPAAIIAARDVGQAFDGPGFGLRIQKIAELYGRYSDAAAAIGLSEGGIKKWCYGITQPGFDAAAVFALGKGVSLFWLATGQGDMFGGGQPRIDRETILAAFVDLSPEQRAMLVKAAADIDTAKSIYGHVAKGLST